MALSLTSPAFSQGGTIPKKYTYDGENRSPPFEWTGVPAGTAGSLLICNDTDSPGKLLHHWAAELCRTMSADRRQAECLSFSPECAQLGGNTRGAIGDLWRNHLARSA